MSESKVQVAVRIRPLLGKEKIERCTTCVDVLSDRELMMGGDKQFTFDHVFDFEVDQGTVYNKCVAPLVENLFDGYNATVLAYGQTGSGKTFTMGSGCTAADAFVADTDRGVIPRATAHVFELISQKRNMFPGAEFYLRVQFLELYGETLRDLLDPVGTAQGKQVSIRDGPNDTLQVVGATEETVKSPQDMLALLEKGTLCRTTGSTDMNTHSSRSHAIFTIVLEQHLKSSKNAETGGEEEADAGLNNDENETEYRTAKFHFVDLAGSERAKRTGATGQRMREGININMGLLALGNVISALGSEEAAAGGGPKFVSYRDSKLTRMLQDSLGGNSRTLMIACISPADINFEETLNALRYANRARNIKNRAIVNRDPASSQIAALKAQVAQLKLQIANGGGGMPFSDKGGDIGGNGRQQKNGFSSDQTFGGEDYHKKCQMLEDEVARLVESLEREKRSRLELEDRFALLEAERVAFLGGASDTSSLSLDELEEDEREMQEVEESLLRSEVPSSSATSNSQMGKKTGPLNQKSQREGASHEVGEEEEEVDHSANLLKQKFQKSQKALKKLFSTYDETLKSKEEAMKLIVEERAKFEALKLHFESKMAEMNEEVRETEAQREVLEAKLRELESEHLQTDFSKSEAQKLRAQMAEKDKRLRELEDRTRQLNEARKAAAEWQKKEAVVRSEIENVKREKVELQRKMNENHKKHLEELKERKLEIAGLKRERARLEQDTNQLAARTERDSKLIQQKSEQVAAMQRKLREAQRLVLHPQALSEREKKQRRELEKLAALQVKREEELADLRRALAKKEEAIARRNLLVEQLEKLRKGESLQQIQQTFVSESINIQELVPEATQEDVKELEQRLEAADSEILFRDRQCQQVLLKKEEDGVDQTDVNRGGEEVGDSSEQVVLTFSTMDQAKECCRILMQMFVESKKELRERKIELERIRDQILHQDQAVKMERRRTETLLNGVSTGNGSSSPSKSAKEDGHVTENLVQDALRRSTQPGIFNPTTPAKAGEDDVERNQQLVASEVRIKTIEAKLRSLRVDESPPTNEANGDNTSSSASNNNNSRRNSVPVWDRLTSPSAATGIHKYGIPYRRASNAVSTTSSSQQVNALPEEEECIDEIIVKIPNRRQARQQPKGVSVTTTAAAPTLDDEEEDTTRASTATGNAITSSNKFTAKIEAIFADQPSPEKPKPPAAGWERVAAQTTESYSNKRLLDAEARRTGSTTGGIILRGRPNSPTRKAPLPPSLVSGQVGGSLVPGKENNTNARPATIPQQQQQNDTEVRHRTRKEHIVSERARRRTQGSAALVPPTLPGFMSGIVPPTSTEASGPESTKNETVAFVATPNLSGETETSAGMDLASAATEVL